MEDRIEQRITIRATQDKVWHLVTRPGWWLPGSGAEPARGPGRVAVGYSGDARPYLIDVVRVEPPGYASFRWSSAFGGAEPAPGNATLIEFYLRPVGDETGVTVVESGFTSLDLPEALREDEWKGSKGGWQYELSGLRTRAESHREALGRLWQKLVLTRIAYSPRSRTRAGVSCLNSWRGDQARARAAWRRCCQSPGRRSRSTWPSLRRPASSPAGGRGGRCCSPSALRA
jgi:uncharacterized protein YndB with AHSA1/START domain